MFFICAGLTLFPMSLLAATAGPGSDEALSRIIDNVAKNEALYSNVDVRLRDTYSIGGREPGRFVNPDISEVISHQLSIHDVHQGSLFRLDVKGSARLGGNKVHSRNRIRAFDGAITRLYDQDALGNLIKGREVDARKVVPHMLLLKHVLPLINLSSYLRGKEAMAADPDNQMHNDKNDYNITYIGHETFDGLKCHKISITDVGRNGRKPMGRCDIWLAEMRNYMPVRVLGYVFRYSTTQPVTEGLVSQWQEVGPGIWFPVSASQEMYEPLVVMKEGRNAVRWRNDYFVESVSLDPKYPLEFFRTVVFPKGTAMYEIENGKILRSYRQGGPAIPNRADTGRGWWIAGANAIAIILIAIYLARRRARSTARHAT